MAVDVLTPRARQRVERLERVWREPSGITGWLTTTDHKRIGILYFFTSTRTGVRTGMWISFAVTAAVPG